MTEASTEKKTITVGEEEVDEETFRRLRQQGKIVFRPKKNKDGVLETVSGTKYTRGPDGSLRRVGGSAKMSKKQRRKVRREAFQAEGSKKELPAGLD